MCVVKRSIYVLLIQTKSLSFFFTLKDPLAGIKGIT